MLASLVDLNYFPANIYLFKATIATQEKEVKYVQR